MNAVQETRGCLLRRILATDYLINGLSTIVFNVQVALDHWYLAVYSCIKNIYAVQQVDRVLAELRVSIMRSIFVYSTVILILGGMSRGADQVLGVHVHGA